MLSMAGVASSPSGTRLPTRLGRLLPSSNFCCCCCCNNNASSSSSLLLLLHSRHRRRISTVVAAAAANNNANSNLNNVRPSAPTFLLPRQSHLCSRSFATTPSSPSPPTQAPSLAELLDPTPPPPPATFESVGVLPRIAYNLRHRLSCPHPTAAQMALFPVLLSHRDVILKDQTGTGKTLGLVAALLSKKWPVWTVPAERLHGARESVGGLGGEADADPPQRRKKARYTAAIVVTPTPELAIQIYGWARTLLLHNKGPRDPTDAVSVAAHYTGGGGVQPQDLPLHIQCIVSHNPDTHAAQSALLAKHPHPTVVIGTPRRLLEMVEAGELDVTRLQSLVLDEVDSLVNVGKRYDQLSTKFHRKSHPTFAERLVENIMKQRKESKKRAEEDEEARAPSSDGAPKKGSKRKSLLAASRSMLIGEGKRVDPALRRMQVVVCSATVNSRVRSALDEKGRGWLSDPVLLDVKGTINSPSAVRHHCLVLDSATRAVRGIRSKEEDTAIVTAAIAAEQQKQRPGFQQLDDDEGERGGGVTRVWDYKKRHPALADDDPAMMDLVAEVCRRENVQRGILFLNANVSVARVVENLRLRGVRAGGVLDEIDIAEASSAVTGSNAHEDAHEDAATSAAAGDADGSSRAPVGDGSASALPTEPQPSSTSEPHPQRPRFLSGAHRLLVITEPMARGLDLAEVTHVLIASLPSSPASFLHMSGRVGRFGRPGTAIVLLAGERYERQMIDIYRLIQTTPAPLPSWS